MATVTRIVHKTTEHDGSEREMLAADALVDMAEYIAASQAREAAPRVRIREHGKVILVWPNGDKITYLTWADTSIPIRRG